MPALSLGIRPAPSIVVPPPAESESSLFADVIGERRAAGEKGACRIARLIEETLIARGWPQGTSCGTEQSLAGGFGVGRAIIRETVRILEVRGTARMTRGPGGGLRVTEIDPRHTADFLIGFGLFSGVTAAQLTEADEILRRVRTDLDAHPAGPDDEAGGCPTAVLDLFDSVVSALQGMRGGAESVASGPSVLLALEVLRQSRAGQIAGRMLRECSAHQWVQGHRLGSEEDLCFRYGADRDSFRQAVRILESAGAVETFCGRGNGLMSQAPRTGAVARLVSCFFASNGVPPQAVMRVFQQMNVEIVALAAGKASPDDCERVAGALEHLEDALDRRDARRVLRCLFETEEAIISSAANPVLHLFVQSLRGYPSAHIPWNSTFLETMNREYLRLSRPILAALRLNSPELAASAQKARAFGLSSLSRTFQPAFKKRH